MGRRIDRAHGHKWPTEVAAEKSKLEFDYTYYNAEGESCEKSDAVAATLVGVDCDSGCPLVLPTMLKDADYEYLIAGVEHFVRRLNHQKCIFRSDGKPALAALMEKVKERCSKSCDIKLELTPRYSPQSIGTVANMQRLVGGQLRTMRHYLETKYAHKIKPDCNLWPWPLRHAGWLIEKCHIELNGHTAHRDLAASAYHGELVPCCETILYRVVDELVGLDLDVQTTSM